MGTYNRHGKVTNVTLERVRASWDVWITHYHGSAEYNKTVFYSVSKASRMRLIRLLQEQPDLTLSISYSLL